MADDHPFVGSDMRLDALAYLSPSAQLFGTVFVGRDASIWPNVVMRAEVHEIRIGKRTNIQDFVMIHVGERTPTVIGDDCSITHRATLHGCTIEDRCLIGINATIMDGAVIGKNSIVAGHSIVTELSVFPANSIIAGVPAKLVKRRDNSAANLSNARIYCRNAKNYAMGIYRLQDDDLRMDKTITFARLSSIAPEKIAAHMSDPRVAEHMPLLTSAWDRETAKQFVATKEQSWTRDGLGHWAILVDGNYVGWGGFQKEGDEWDFGLVLKPDSFGLGMRIARKAFEIARADPRIPYVTFLLPLSRVNLGALGRLGAVPDGDVTYEGVEFQRFRLEMQ